MRPLIAITSRSLKSEKGDPEVSGAALTYQRAIESAGGAPLILPFLDDTETVKHAAALCSGLLLTGGEDMAPALYGETAHAKLGPVCPVRDKNEIALLNWALEASIPVLAICRGIQVLNVALGGSLYQDLASQHNPDSPHLGGIPRPWKELRHGLKLSPGCRIATILGTEETRVNSIHHQAIKMLAPGLMATGWAEDGVIEAVEMPDASFVIGVQCHPETMWDEVSPVWAELFKEFVRAAGARRSCG